MAKKTTLQNKLTNMCPRLTIFPGRTKTFSSETSQAIFGEIWTDKELLGKMSITECIYPKRERLEVMYIGQKRKIKLPKWLCKKCFYAWPARQEDPPEKCANYKGYTDEEDGSFHEKCGSRHWDQWEPDFNPATCKYTRVLKTWYDEQEEQRLAKAS